jgi:triosephosphate isomerase
LIVIVAANWKMNPSIEDAGALAAAYAGTAFDGIARILFPPHPYLVHMAMRLGQSGIRLGGQDCHSAASGAHTGDVAAHMLAALILCYSVIPSAAPIMVKVTRWCAPRPGRHWPKICR